MIEKVSVGGQLRFARLNDGMIHYHDQNGRRFTFCTMSNSWTSPAQCEVASAGPSKGNIDVVENTTSHPSFGDDNREQKFNAKYSGLGLKYEDLFFNTGFKKESVKKEGIFIYPFANDGNIIFLDKNDRRFVYSLIKKEWTTPNT